MDEIAAQKKDSQHVSSGLLTEHDVFLFKEGTHARLSEKLGAHLITREGRDGVHFAVWAPNAEAVSVIGDFNGWDKFSHPLAARPDGSGIWEGFVPTIGSGECYKYHITSREQNYQVDKADPYAMFSEVPPLTSSRVWDMAYTWNDGEWMSRRRAANALNAPMSIYEVQAWEKEASEAFLKGYRDVIQGCPSWPAAPGAAERLIEFFVIEKDLYELRYEMDNRSDWLPSPLFSLLRTLVHKEGETS